MSGHVNRDGVKDCIDWPIKYPDLEAYYSLAEEYIGVSGDSADKTVPRSKAYPFAPFPFSLQDKPVVQAMHELGYCYGNLPIARQGISDVPSHRAPCQTTGTCKYCPFGARYAAANFLNYMNSHEDFENFNIKANCIVEEILMSSKKIARGISYRNINGSETGEILASRIIVAAGAIESAKLLLRSKADGWAYGLGNASEDGLVGRHFITHPYFIFQGTIPSNPLQLQPEMDFPTLCSRHFDSEQEQAKGKFIVVNPPGSPSLNLAKQMKNGSTKDQILKDLSGKNIVQLHGMVEFFSQKANRVNNCLKRNHLGLWETQVVCSRDSGIKERIVDIEAVVAKIFKKMGVSDVGLNVYSWRADHAASVCRMGKDESEGVVDSNLKIFGTDNVYVLSNAVFPSLGAVNPTLTLAALALRLGDHLSKLELAEGAASGAAAPVAAASRPAEGGKQ
jgi:choline dehydrogenase-like flavoprotein